jgi:2-methylfumaryl-CoA isomerase
MTEGDAPKPPAPVSGILEGLRIVEVSAFVAAPLGGATLAAMGADVVRVDPLKGGVDQGRWPVFGGRSLYWDGLNRGKRSVAVDLDSKAGRELVSRLITAPGEGGGFLLTNLAGRDWISYSALSELRPDVIVVQIEGNRDGTPAVDYTVNAATGFAWVTGPETETGPTNHVLPAWDCMAGYLAATALLAAERHRSRTGKGQLVQISLPDVALAVASHLGLLAEAQLEPEPHPRLGNDIFGSFGRDFRTADRRFVMVVALTRRHWQALIEATGLESEIAELEQQLGVDLGEEGNRYRNRRPLVRLLQTWFAARDLAEVSSRLSSSHCLWGPYQTFKELLDSDSRSSPGSVLETVDQPGLGPLLVAGLPLRFGAGGGVPPAPAPSLGQHTAEVLEERLELSAHELTFLRQKGVIA